MNTRLPEEAPGSTGRDVAARRFRGRWQRWLRKLGRIVASLLLVILVIGWWKILRIEENPSWPPPSDAITAAQAQAATGAFLRREDASIADLAIPLATSTLAGATFYSDGTEFFPPIIEDLAAAQHSIHILMFTITPGDIAGEVIATLEERAAAGVEVRFITDRYGGKVFSRSSDLFDRLTAAGVQVVINDIFPIDRNGLLQDRDIDWQQDEVGNADHRNCGPRSSTARSLSASISRSISAALPAG